MLKIGNYAVDITITLPDGEVADLLGISNDDESLEVAYDTIDWDSIEDELTGLAQRLLATQGESVLAALTEAGLGEDEQDEG